MMDKIDVLIKLAETNFEKLLIENEHKFKRNQNIHIWFDYEKNEFFLTDNKFRPERHEEDFGGHKHKLCVFTLKEATFADALKAAKNADSLYWYEIWMDLVESDMPPDEEIVARVA